MPVNLKVSGVWKSVSPFLRVSGVWKAAIPWLRVSGVWKILSNIFHPMGGTYGDDGTDEPATYTITCDVSAVWTYTTTGNVGSSCNVASGGSATSITFTLLNGGVPGGIRNNTWTVQGTVSGYPVENYTIILTTENNP